MGVFHWLVPARFGFSSVLLCFGPTVFHYNWLLVMNLVCHSLQLHITHGLHLPSCTAQHTFPSTITPITQLSPFTHQPWLPHHTCTSFTHSHKSSTQTLTQCEVLFSPVFWFPVFTWTAYLLWPFAACPFDPACLLISSLSAACPDLALSLLLILPCLRDTCYCLWPLPVWPSLVVH